MWLKENSHLSAGPVSSGFGNLVSVLPGSCTHPAPAHSLVYKQSEMDTKTTPIIYFDLSSAIFKAVEHCLFFCCAKN